MAYDYGGGADRAESTFTRRGTAVRVDGAVGQAASAGVSVVNVYCGGVQCESITVRVS